MDKKRLIDAVPILQDFIKIADRNEGKNPYENVKIKAYRRCFERVADAPKVDAVEVVRCGECKHHHWEQEPCHGKTVHTCDLPHMKGVETFKAFFCYFGERKGK